MGNLSDYIEIIRPINSVMVGVAILVGAIITGGLRVLDNELVLLYSFVTGFTLTGASMAVNDYYDRVIDAVNEPHRPIPSGRVSPKNALLLTVILSIFGLATSLLVSFAAFGIAFVAWSLMMIYSMWGKKTGFFGNLMVSICISLPFLYGGLLSGRVSTSVSFSLLALLSNAGREITKGIVDVQGDEASGINTIAVVYGANRAADVASFFFLAAVFASGVPVYLNLVSLWYVPFVLITDLGLIISAYQIIQDPSRDNSRRIKNRVLYLMMIGLIGFTAGSLII